MDCSKTETFFSELKRMCNKYNSTCVGCKIYSICFDTGCYGFIKDNPQEAIEIVQKWNDSNPVKTRQSEFLKMFPDANIINGVIDICPEWVDTKFENCNPKLWCYECKEKYWLTEVK